ncbi:piggyBac transposable element-derived protein 4 [Helicoverpa armigera]|uniref:piggyBac transposable element-derived protein 4 n=1 Tax=Helicoverpa armigera TaxID=29058 RepID=UPI0030826ED7
MNRGSKRMAEYAATERSRSVSPVADVVRGPNRQSAARRALLLERLRATPVRDLDSPPPRLPVQATPGGSLNVPLEQTPGGRLRIGEARQARQPSLDLSLCSDVVERVEALDMSEDEAAELLQSDPWHVKRWMRDLPGASELPRVSNTVVLAPLAPSARSEVPVAAELDVRPSTSTEAALSQTVPRRDGSDLDSEFDDEFDVPVMPIVRDLPDTEELDESLQDLVNDIDTGMDDAADCLLGTSATFTWSPDFDSFRGVRGEFSGPTPGPIKDYETPYDAFTDIWDEDIVRLIATETNRYAHQTIETMRNAGTLKPSSRLHSWTDTNADEIMVFFAMLMYMAIDPRTSVTEYWTSDEVLQLPGFKSLMSFNRYTLLNKCLHFVDNDAVQSQQLSQSGVSCSAGVSRRLGKLAPIIEHLGKKFKALYNLGADISIDESLTLFKGRLSWAQTIRSKAARFGIKSYELCESRTGYMARFQIYTGKDDSSDGDLSLGVDLGEKSTKVVLELLQGLEHRGHCVVMDNYYNCPSLARYLKSLGFDCLGTLRVNRRHVPADFKVSDKVKKGTIISRHSGDVSIIAWMDSKMVNIISTYHRPDTYNGTRAGKPMEKPVCIKDYNKSMGGVDLKNQKLSMYLLERKRGVKWYMKMFKRLLNVSIHNALVMYQSSLIRTTDKLPVTHREFRYALAESLLKRHRSCSIGISHAPVENMRLRRDIMHEPEHLMGRQNTKRCMICQRQKKSKAVHSRCITCDVYLCFGDCWRIWHSAKELPGVDIRGRKRKRKE